MPKLALRSTLALLALVLPAAPARAQDPVARADTLAAGVVRVCAGGDVTMGTNLDPGWARFASAKYGMRVEPFPDPDSLLAPLRPLVADADVVLLNVEGAIGEGVPARRKCAPGSTACFAFRM
ncbi:MAG TPA: hypothetical protein VK399_14705, partial [Longimicrobiaceae bacterium]|nr:hypothetical protein [Longimicrobiaceae bacterium]